MHAHAAEPRQTTSRGPPARNRSSPAAPRRAHLAPACVRSAEQAPRNPPEKLASPTRRPTRKCWSQRRALEREREEPRELVRGPKPNFRSFGYEPDDLIVHGHLYHRHRPAGRSSWPSRPETRSNRKSPSEGDEPSDLRHRRRQWQRTRRRIRGRKHCLVLSLRAIFVFRDPSVSPPDRPASASRVKRSVPGGTTHTHGAAPEKSRPRRAGRHQSSTGPPVRSATTRSDHGSLSQLVEQRCAKVGNRHGGTRPWSPRARHDRARNSSHVY